MLVPTEGQLCGGPQPVYVQGFLTIPNVKRKLLVTGTLQLRGNDLVVTSRFSVAPADYKIKFRHWCGITSPRRLISA